MSEFLTLHFYYGLQVGVIAGIIFGVTFAIVVKYLQEREANPNNLKDETFYWWWGWGTDPEMFYGPYDTRLEAVTDAEDDAEPDDSFSIMEANKAPTSDACLCFDGHDIWESFCELNDECWGEDGPPDPPESLLLNELETSLTNTFGQWRRKHGVGQGWRFDQTRNEEEHTWDEELKKRVKL